MAGTNRKKMQKWIEYSTDSLTFEDERASTIEYDPF
jgi:hypothetical protein